MPRKALKHDDNKLRYSLLLDEFVQEMIRVRMFGAEKYEPWDWLHGLEFSRYQDAIKRHLKDFNSGEDLDKESGYHHMAHIAINAMFLYTFQMLDAGVDDRHGVRAERILQRLRDEEELIMETDGAIEHDFELSRHDESMLPDEESMKKWQDKPEDKYLPPNYDGCKGD